MELSSLLNPQSRPVTHPGHTSEPGRSSQFKHISRRSASYRLEGSRDVAGDSSLRHESDNKLLRHHSHYQEAREVNWSARNTSKGHTSPPSNSSSTRQRSNPLSPTSPGFGHSHDRYFPLAGTRTGPSSVRSRSRTAAESRRVHPWWGSEAFALNLGNTSRPSSASSTSITTPLFGRYGSPESATSSHYVESTLSPVTSGYTTSPTDSLTAFATVAIRKPVRPGYKSSASYQYDNQMSSNDRGYGYFPGQPEVRSSSRQDLMMESDEASLSPASSAASPASERPAGASDLDRLRRFKGKGAQRQSFGSDAPSDSSEVMRIPSLLGSPPRSLPPQHEPSEANFLADDGGPRCSYTENCTTGSPLRKVVSHIFGRNKLCTRQIPKGVWVHYCRKHYQRSRYRNPKGFALLQCDLVRKQVDRLQMWGGVADWIVKVRKREEVRLNKENAELAAGRLQHEEGSGADNDVEMDQGGSRAPGPSASSRWLIGCTGPGKSTMEVLDILSRIEQEITETGSNFPDVEILPNVVADMARPSSSASSRLPRGRPLSEGLLNSPDYPSSRYDAPGRAYEANPGIFNRRLAAVEAERKRKASMGNIDPGTSAPQPSEGAPRALHRVETFPGLGSGLVKRQRTGIASEDDDVDEETSPDTPQGSPQRERGVLLHQLPERVRSATMGSPRPVLPSIDTIESGRSPYGSHRRGPSFESYSMSPDRRS